MTLSRVSFRTHGCRARHVSRRSGASILRDRCCACSAATGCHAGLRELPSAFRQPPVPHAALSHRLGRVAWLGDVLSTWRSPFSCRRSYRSTEGLLARCAFECAARRPAVYAQGDQLEHAGVWKLRVLEWWKFGHHSQALRPLGKELGACRRLKQASTRISDRPRPELVARYSSGLLISSGRNS